MFQYAAGRALALRSNDVLKLDLSWFGDTGRHIERPFKLRAFNINILEAKEDEVERFIPPSWRKAIGLYDHKRYIRERAFSSAKDVKRSEEDVYLDGYWHGEKCFKDFEEKIRGDFTLRDAISEEAKTVVDAIQHTDNSVALHIRRGDYVKSLKTRLFHGICSLEYYERAVEYMRSKIGEIKLFVFSDDIEWAKGQSLFNGANFVSKPDIKDYEELVIMSVCKHNIIANSSFSWWGSWLNKNPGKIIIAPRRWFNLKKEGDLVPSSWIRV